MTVAMMIEALKKFPPTHRVVVDLHSEYALAGEPRLMEGWDNGGYVSEVRTPEQKLRAHGWIHIPVAPSGDR